MLGGQFKCSKELGLSQRGDEGLAYDLACDHESATKGFLQRKTLHTKGTLGGLSLPPVHATGIVKDFENPTIQLWDNYSFSH
jgi:hypothetical protein